MAAAAKTDGQDPSPSSASSMDGQNKVIATAQQIIKSLATDRSAAEDMLRILSSFDNRLSSMHVSNDGVTLAADDDVTQDDEDDDEEEEEEEEEECDEIRLEVVARIDEAEKLISFWNSAERSNQFLFDFSQEEIVDYLFFVDDVISIAFKEEFQSYGDLIEKADLLIQIAMDRFEEEFRHLMTRNVIGLNASELGENFNEIVNDDVETATEAGDSPSSGHRRHRRMESSMTEVAGSPTFGHRRHRRQESSNLGDENNQNEALVINPETVEYLKDIAERMMQAGYEKELYHVYSVSRREVLDRCLGGLGVDRMSIDEVQKVEWRILDEKMKKWIQALKEVVNVVLCNERRLAGQIFTDCEKQSEECFVESAKGCVMQLLNFADAIAIQKRASEKLFRIVDMYEALLEVKPNLGELFTGELGDYVMKEIQHILEWLADAVRGTLVEFANAIQKENSRKPMQGGEIHPLTRYVMNYVKLLVDYSGPLESLLDDNGDIFESENGVDSGESNTHLGCRLQLLLSYLETNLDGKAKLYEDVAMQFIFLMNNRHYIVQKIKDSDLQKIVGDNWVRKRRGQIRQYHNSYLRASWTKPLSYLKDTGLGGSGNARSVSKVALKERFKNFNLAFEDNYKTQSTWKVPDPQLREELRVSTSEKILPAYRSFLGRYGGLLESTRHAAKYIKYTPEDLESYLLELFEEPAGLSTHHRRKLSLS